MPPIKCFECKNEIEEETSRKWKGDRICKPCYKSHRNERKLDRLARGL